MKLSDVVSAMHVSIYATLPLLIFFGIFVGVGIYLLQGKPHFERAGRLPLDPSEKEREEAQ